LNSLITEYIESKGIDNVRNFLSRDAGILCSDASLPASAYATGEVKDNFMGIPQEFAHTRLYTDIDFTFYVDQDYTSLSIFEGWMDFISSGVSNNLSDKGFFRRFRYPDDYKVNTMTITKFEKNLERTLMYEFKNAFPKSITSLPVTYGTADLMKVTVSFNYDRYVVTRS
tara:strand:+ start:80 stop:589 length:510 start_codon:yes stop_codon:yes gene_type:complete